MLGAKGRLRNRNCSLRDLICFRCRSIAYYQALSRVLAQIWFIGFKGCVGVMTKRFSYSPLQRMRQIAKIKENSVLIWSSELAKGHTGTTEGPRHEHAATVGQTHVFANASRTIAAGVSITVLLIRSSERQSEPMAATQP